MAAPKGEQELNKLFDQIIKEITEEGKSALSAITGKMSTSTFYILLEDNKKSNRYTRATEIRAELIADETIKIADEKEGDVQRDRLRVDTRKWLLAKLYPKKYGDKVELEHKGIVKITGINYIVPDGDNDKTDK